MMLMVILCCVFISGACGGFALAQPINQKRKGT